MTSIRRRLLVVLVPITAVALVATAVAIEQAVQRDLAVALDHTLEARARGLAAGVDLAVDGSFEFEPGDEVLAEVGAVPSERFYAVTEADGRVLAGSPGVPGRFEPPPTRSMAFRARPVRDKRFRICWVPVEREPEADEEDLARWREAHPARPLPPREIRSLWVAVGQNTRPLDETFAALRTRLWLGFGTLFLVLAVMPGWATSRALKPLRRLSTQADQVGPDSPASRLDEDGVGQEVHGLVVALNRALGRLAGAYQRQKQFTADAAHELRSPVSVIRTQCEVALRRPRNAGELRDTVVTVHAAALRLGSLVERLLGLSKLEAHVGEGRWEEVDLTGVAREAAAVHGPVAAAKGVDLVIDLPTPLPARGDAEQLGECLSNLVENAVRSTPEGGQVTMEPLPGVVPGVRVTDTGIGIPAKHLPKIFDRFYQVDPARSTADSGTGLGLAIAREIARLHGGDLTVESLAGKGSRFELRLPPAGGV